MDTWDGLTAGFYQRVFILTLEIFIQLTRIIRIFASPRKGAVAKITVMTLIPVYTCISVVLEINNSTPLSLDYNYIGH